MHSGRRTEHTHAGPAESDRHRVIAVVALAVAFGVAMSLVKGNGSGVRDAVGNVSAPWVLLPFFAGAFAGRRSVARAAAVGCAVSLAALAGFYVANAFVLDLGPHPWLHDLRLAVLGGKIYFEFGAVSGPVFGALGGWWQRRRSALVGVLAAALLLFEPLVWLAYAQAHHTPASSLAYFGNPVVWVFEVVVGVAACLVAATVARPDGAGVRRP